MYKNKGFSERNVANLILSDTFTIEMPRYKEYRKLKKPCLFSRIPKLNMEWYYSNSRFILRWVDQVTPYFNSEHLPRFMYKRYAGEAAVQSFNLRHRCDSGRTQYGSCLEFEHLIPGSGRDNWEDCQRRLRYQPKDRRATIPQDYHSLEEVLAAKEELMLQHTQLNQMR